MLLSHGNETESERMKQGKERRKRRGKVKKVLEKKRKKRIFSPHHSTPPVWAGLGCTGGAAAEASTTLKPDQHHHWLTDLIRTAEWAKSAESLNSHWAGTETGRDRCTLRITCLSSDWDKFYAFSLVTKEENIQEHVFANEESCTPTVST